MQATHTHKPHRSVSSSAALSTGAQPSSSWFSMGFGAGAASNDSEIETLYTHPNVKIVAFVGGGLDPAPGSLPWTSPAERTIAVGNLSIYRAPGSVAFVNCGSALQPILRKSQCWCVDEESTKFVLQIRRPSYWRIELPLSPEGTSNTDLRALSQPLRDVFDRILLFEKTECPFRRSFRVELPEAQPVRRVPWVPRPLSQPVEDRDSPSPPSRWARRRMTDGVVDSDGRASPSPRCLTEPFPGGELTLTTGHERSSSVVEFQSRRRYWQERQAQVVEDTPDGSDKGSPRRRASTLSSGSLRRTRTRPVCPVLTALSPPPPPSITTETTTAFFPSPPPTFRSSSPPEAIAEEEVCISPRSSIIRDPPDSANTAHSFATAHSFGTSPSYDTAPSWPIDPELQDALRATKERESRSPSGASERPRPTSSSWDTASNTSSHASQESTTTTAPDIDPSDKPSSRSIRAPRLRHHRSSISLGPGVAAAATLSPLPPAVNLFSPVNHLSATNNNNNNRRRLVPARSMEVLRRIPMAIISKAVEVVLGPPRYLLALMLRIAAKITAGEWSGVVFGFDENGDQIPVHWDYSDGYSGGFDNDNDGDDDERWWGAGVSRDGRHRPMPGGYRPPQERRRSVVELVQREPRSWEVD